MQAMETWKGRCDHNISQALGRIVAQKECPSLEMGVDQIELRNKLVGVRTKRGGKANPMVDLFICMSDGMEVSNASVAWSAVLP